MTSLSKYICDFEKLKRAYQFGGAPHKPILLLSIIDAIEKGYIKNERIYITIELLALFRNNWQLWVKTPHVRNFALPFYHMKSEPFWHLILNPNETLQLTKSKSIKSFNALDMSVDYALIDRELFLIMNDPVSREELRNILIKKYFPLVQNISYASIDYLNDVAQQILNDSAIQYKRKINHIKSLENDDLFEEEVVIRNGVFKREIPKAYNYTCSISGMRVYLKNGQTLIDGCHIMPFSKTQDDTITNGIALCPNLHRAFDNGYITISNDYKVIVSSHLIETESNYSIHQFHNKKINLPMSEIHYPRKDVLEWHRDCVFEKRL